MKSDNACAGRLRTKADNPSITSGWAAYSSGLKHHGKIPRITVSGTPTALANSRQLSTTARRNASVFDHALWSESDSTLSGYFAASHIPTEAPKDRPHTCALDRPTA